jgi:hypothetical protein
MKASIQELFPNFPDDIIAQWLLPLAEKDGWPPLEIDGVICDEKWKAYLGPHPSIDYWQNIEWVLKEIDLSYEDLGWASKSIVTQVVQSAILGVDRHTVERCIPGSRNTFLKAVSHLSQYGVYPKPPVLVFMDSKYEIVDGTHRISAFLYCAGLLKKVETPSKDIVLKLKPCQKMWLGLSKLKGATTE